MGAYILNNASNKNSWFDIFAFGIKQDTLKRRTVGCLLSKLKFYSIRLRLFCIEKVFWINVLKRECELLHRVNVHVLTTFTYKLFSDEYPGNIRYAVCGNILIEEQLFRKGLRWWKIKTWNMNHKHFVISSCSFCAKSKFWNFLTPSVSEILKDWLITLTT